jgi:hypothetical protein
MFIEWIFFKSSQKMIFSSKLPKTWKQKELKKPFLHTKGAQCGSLQKFPDDRRTSTNSQKLAKQSDSLLLGPR